MVAVREAIAAGQRLEVESQVRGVGAQGEGCEGEVVRRWGDGAEDRGDSGGQLGRGNAAGAEEGGAPPLQTAFGKQEVRGEAQGWE